MKNFNKKAETTVIKANGVDEDRFVAQYNSSAPHIRIYERKKRGDKVVHAKVGEFYKLRKGVQRCWSLSQKQGD